MKEQANKICVVCGREYTPRRYDQLTCSVECRAVHNAEVKKNRKKDYYRYKPTAKCKICGKTVDNGFKSPFRRGSATMHDECVFEDCINTIVNGGSLTHVQRLRLDARGYTVNEFKEEFLNIKDTTKADWNKINTGLLCLD